MPRHADAGLATLMKQHRMMVNASNDLQNRQNRQAPQGLSRLWRLFHSMSSLALPARCSTSGPGTGIA